MHKTETEIEEIEMPWVYSDGGFSESGLTKHRRKYGNGVVAAIAVAEGRYYREVYDELRSRQLNFVWKTRSKTKQEHSGDPHHGVFPEVYKPYLLDRGWLWTPTMTVGSGVTMHLSYEEIPDLPVFIARVSKNLITVINGVAHATYDPSRGGCRAMYGFFGRS